MHAGVSIHESVLRAALSSPRVSTYGAPTYCTYGTVRLALLRGVAPAPAALTHQQGRIRTSISRATGNSQRASHGPGRPGSRQTGAQD